MCAARDETPPRGERTCPAGDNSARTPGIYLLRAPSLPMLATRPRKADAFLILIGLVIFVLLVLGVVLLVRRQPQLAPKASGAMAMQAANAGFARPKPVPWQR